MDLGSHLYVAAIYAQYKVNSHSLVSILYQKIQDISSRKSTVSLWSIVNAVPRLFFRKQSLVANERREIYYLTLFFKTRLKDCFPTADITKGKITSIDHMEHLGYWLIVQLNSVVAVQDVLQVNIKLLVGIKGDL